MLQIFSQKTFNQGYLRDMQVIKNASKPVNDVRFFGWCDKIKFPRKKPLRGRSKFNRNVGCKIWPGYIMQQEVWLPNEDDPNREKYIKVYYSGNRQ